jgi:hypothetical protein
VSHFSKYSCDVEESEEDAKADEGSLPKICLGGPSIHQAHSKLERGEYSWDRDC